MLEHFLLKNAKSQRCRQPGLCIQKHDLHTSLCDGPWCWQPQANANVLVEAWAATIVLD